MSQEKITAMRTGGHKLGHIRDSLALFAAPGKTFADIEKEAQRLIYQAGAKPSFSTVPNYDWATCVMKNDSLCHGIPGDQIIADGDLMTIDIGLIYQDYHLDTTISFVVGQATADQQHFMNVGKKALAKAVQQVKPGVSVYQISKAMQSRVEKSGFEAVTSLTGHGIGKQLHMEPSIPCVAQNRDKRVILHQGQTVAIEIMYAAGSAQLTIDNDHWTYRTADGSLSGMYEDTVLVTATGYEVLTKPSTSGII